jgi:hypothetical protein
MARITPRLAAEQDFEFGRILSDIFKANAVQRQMAFFFLRAQLPEDFQPCWTRLIGFAESVEKRRPLFAFDLV